MRIGKMSRGLSYRRPIALCLLMAYALAATGIPVQGPVLAIRSGERFPCESCGCGCQTAEHCWNNCCCHTLAQRLAWAKREDVRPPEDVLRRAQQAGHDVSLWLGGTLLPARQACLPQQSSSKSCCCCCQPKRSEEAPPDDQSAAWRSLACGGALQHWLSISVAVEIADHPDEAAQALVAAPCVVTPWLESTTLIPPTPPPECLA